LSTTSQYISSSFFSLWSSLGTTNRMTVMRRRGICSDWSWMLMRVLRPEIFSATSFDSSCSRISSSFGGTDLS